MVYIFTMSLTGELSIHIIILDFQVASSDAAVLHLTTVYSVICVAPPSSLNISN